MKKFLFRMLVIILTPIYIIVQIFKKLLEFMFDITEPIAEAQYKLVENMMSFWKKVFKKRVKL